MQIHELALEELAAHPNNSNVMGEAALAKLSRHIEQTDRYPPIIVRPLEGTEGRADGPAYQIIDGHHRVKALARLGRPSARAVIWHVDEAEALKLLATLNRLEGQDDPRRRARLIGELSAHRPLETLASELPEPAEKLKRMVEAGDEPPAPAAPASAEAMPEAVHFFLLPEQRRQVEAKLHAIGGPREAALLQALGLN